MADVMTTDHLRWREFMDRLEGPEGCNFRVVEGKTVWNCATQGTDVHKHSRAILESMGCDVEASLDYFRGHGGYCDCEVIFNVDDT